jgi:hypothetical protein
LSNIRLQHKACGKLIVPNVFERAALLLVETFVINTRQSLQLVAPDVELEFPNPI